MSLESKIIAWKQEAIDATELKYGQTPQGESINYWRGRRAVLCELSMFLEDEERENNQLRATIETLKANSPSCGACAEFLWCGSVGHEHDKDCPYTQVVQLRAELDKWKSGCEANAADAADCHRKSDERRLEIIKLTEALKQCAEALDKQPHHVRCSMNQPYPFGEKARQSWEHRTCNCWKREALSLPSVQNALKGEK